MKHTPAPSDPSRRQRRAGQALFNKKRERELKALAADQERPGVARFRPAAPRPRHDGWTAPRQRAFIAALADTGSVTQAAKEAGMSRRSAYALRRSPSAQPFRAAWALAIDHASQVMADNATARAVNGYTVAKTFGGEVVHEEVRFNETLVMRLLASRDPYRFGRNPDLAQSEVRAEAAAATLNKALALIDTELVGTDAGQLSLAEAADALDRRLVELDKTEAALMARTGADLTGGGRPRVDRSHPGADDLQRLIDTHYAQFRSHDEDDGEDEDEDGGEDVGPAGPWCDVRELPTVPVAPAAAPEAPTERGSTGRGSAGRGWTGPSVRRL